MGSGLACVGEGGNGVSARDRGQGIRKTYPPISPVAVEEALFVSGYLAGRVWREKEGEEE